MTNSLTIKDIKLNGDAEYNTLGNGFYAEGEDKDGNLYAITWDINPDFDTMSEDMSDAADWANPASITAIN